MSAQADAHYEWHWNTGTPVWRSPCPWDSCEPEYHPEEDEDFDPEVYYEDDYVIPAGAYEVLKEDEDSE